MDASQQTLVEQLNSMIAKAQQEIDQLKAQADAKKDQIKQYRKALKAIAGKS
jgi:uncharacterized coiled-coil protein SlyX